MPATVEFAERLIDAYLSGKTLKMILFTGTATTPTSPDHNFVSDVVADEAEGGGYVRATLASIITTQVEASDRTEVDCTDVVFTALGPLTSDDGVVKTVGFMQQEASDATSPYLGGIDVTGLTESDRTPTGGNFTVRIGSTGFLHLVCS